MRVMSLLTSVYHTASDPHMTEHTLRMWTSSNGFVMSGVALQPEP